jgi:hypothetical protein
MAVASIFTWIAGVAPRAQIALEARRNRDDEHEPALIHHVQNLAGVDVLGELEARRIERVEQLLGQRRLVLVHERDRGVVDLARSSGRLDLDGQR